MIAEIEHKGKKYKINFSKPLDISIPMNGKEQMATAWYVPQTKIEPVKMDDWVGSVKAGAAVNFNNIFFNPHGNGTHTECIGHITETVHSVNQALKEFFFIAELVSLSLQKMAEDLVIPKQELEEKLKGKSPEALVIRTLPNNEDKLHTNYSNSNPPYLLEETAQFIREKGINHLLIDLPSLDREQDDGKLLAHKAFWNYHGEQKRHATITELIYVPDSIPDGTYLLNLQIASFENDATPSKPVLFEII
jgi:arylformamidase